MYPAVKLLVPLSLGIAVGDAVVDEVGPVWWWAMAVGMVIAASVMRHRKYIQSLLLLVAVFMTGAALVADRELSMQVKLPERIAGFNAVLLSEPVIHGKVVQTDLMVIRGNGLLKVKASILRDTLTNRYRSLHTGDGIEAMAYLEKPMNFSDATFDYARWLRLHGFSAETFICPDQWRKKKVNLHLMSFFQRSLLTAAICRQKLMKKLTDNLEGDALAVVTAMTLGDRHLLGKELKEDYSITGASHVLALSGLHLTVVYGLLMLLLGRVERLLPGLRWKGISDLTVLFAVWSYVVLVGMSSSVVRSAMMLTIYSFVSLLNRDRLSVNTLALTAVIMLFCNPLSLFDIGFQLSFVSVWSILLFYPLLYQTLSSRYLKHCAAGRWLWGMTAVSVAAQLGTAPLIAFYLPFLYGFHPRQPHRCTRDDDDYLVIRLHADPLSLSGSFFLSRSNGRTTGLLSGHGTSLACIFSLGKYRKPARYSLPAGCILCHADGGVVVMEFSCWQDRFQVIFRKFAHDYATILYHPVIRRDGVPRLADPAERYFCTGSP